jgi:hypothetical protein
MLPPPVKNDPFLFGSIKRIPKNEREGEARPPGFGNCHAHLTLWTIL